ncbi:hypothetical protein [Flavobacterium sp.]|uniref:hypothetical protein n=1 Tax=Flavobacterium sp. TaxID=239 RepID=UPI00286C27BE|nr:hypothetical protein [Flavobacterium sp.]
MAEEENDSKQPKNNTTKHLLDGAEKWDSKLIHLSKPIIAPSIMNTIIGMQKTLEPLNKIAALSEAANKMGTILSNQTDLAKSMQINETASKMGTILGGATELAKTVKSFQNLSQKATWNIAFPQENLNYLSAIKSISSNLFFPLPKSPVYYATPEWSKSAQLYTYASKSVLDITPQNIGSKINLEKRSRIHLNASFSSLSNSYWKKRSN